MNASAMQNQRLSPEFCEGIQYLGENWPDFSELASHPVIAEGQTAIADPSSEAAVYQTLLGADALR